MAKVGGGEQREEEEEMNSDKIKKRDEKINMVCVKSQ